MQLTLRHKVNGAIIITFLVIAVIFTIIQLPIQKKRLENRINSIEILLQTLVERDAEQLANEIFDARLTAIEIRIRQMIKVAGILGISVFNTYGELLVQEGETVNLVLPPDSLERLKKETEVEEIRQKGQAALLYTKEISFLGDNLGFIQIVFSLEALEQERQNSFMTTATMLVTIFLIMAVVLNLILSRAILSPIMRLRDGTRSILQGDLNNPIDMARTDELGSLARSFDRMRDAVKRQISDLERITSIIESTSDLVAIASPDINVKYLNRAGRRMLGWSEDGPLKDQSLSDVHSAETAEFMKNIAIPAAVKNGTWEGETQLVAADGREIPVSQVVISHRNVDGELEFVSTIMRDISERKHTEDQLRYLRNYLANIIDSMPSMMIGIDVEGNVTQWNAEASRITGIPPERALGKRLYDLMPDLSITEGRLLRAMDDRRMLFEPKQSRHVDDEIRYEDVTVYPLLSEGLKGAVIRIDDVTEKIRMEEVMIQSEKMLSVGGLAAGMAHEINNPLAGMMQAADVLTGRLMNDQMSANKKVASVVGITMSQLQEYMDARQVPKMLDQIREAGKRASEIVVNMLSFARKGNEGLSNHSMTDLLEKTIDLAGSDYNLKKKFDFRRLSLTREYEENLPDVPCEPGKIQQVLFNILRNGAEAMQDLVGINDRPQPGFKLRLIHEAFTGMVRLEIEDNGPGMSEYIRKRIFEPFFTTKSPGNGTGLGLSVSYFIITENHGGTMNVESAPGKGTRFIIRLPAAVGEKRNFPKTEK